MLVVPDARVQPDILAAVLVHVAVVAVALRVEFRREIKGVVIAFQVAVLARVDMLDNGRIGIAQQDRPAAAQHVIQKGLARVGVKERFTGSDGDMIGQFLDQC